MKSQEERRDVQRKITAVQLKLHELHVELDRIPRGDDKYLALITLEHSVIKEEKKLKEEFQHYEKEEREHFSILSHSVRDSHEKERAQAEKTKYWSIIGSVLGTILGVVGTSINNHMKMKELKNLIESTAKSSNVFTNLEQLSKEVSAHLKQQLMSSIDNDTKMFILPEEKWKDLLDSVQALVREYSNQQNVVFELSQRLNDATSMDAIKNPYFLVHHDLETLINGQNQQNHRLVALACILVPTCTWALLKFLNM